VSRVWSGISAVLAAGIAGLGSAGAEPVGKWCSGVRIAAFAGGAEGSAFTTNVANGFSQAQLDLGPTLNLGYFDWDPNKMLAGIKDAVAGKVDGVIAYGLAGDAATDPLIDKLFTGHAIFTVIHSALPRAEGRYLGQGLGFVGAPAYKLGEALGTEAAVRAKLVKGDEVLVWGLRGWGHERGQRTTGVLDALAKVGAKVTYQEIDAATNKDASAGTVTFVGLLKKNPKFKLVVTDHGGLTANAEVLAKAAGLGAGQVYFAGFDFSPEAAGAIADGYLGLVIDQEPYVMGYLSVLDICLAKKFGFIGLDVSTVGAFIDKGNVEAMTGLAKQGVR